MIMCFCCHQNISKPSTNRDILMSHWSLGAPYVLHKLIWCSLNCWKAAMFSSFSWSLSRLSAAVCRVRLEMMKHFFNFALIQFGKLNPFGPRLLFHTPAKVLDCVYLSKGGECKVFSMKKGGIRCIMVNGALTNWQIIDIYMIIYVFLGQKNIKEYKNLIDIIWYYHLFGFFVVLNGTEGALGIPKDSQTILWESNAAIGNPYNKWIC